MGALKLGMWKFRARLGKLRLHVAFLCQLLIDLLVPWLLMNRNPLDLGVIFSGFLLIKALWMQLDDSGEFRNGAAHYLLNRAKCETRFGNITFGEKKSLFDCDIYNGQWERDETKPYYPPSSCPYIDRDFDCHLNGRPDSDYLKWRWQPYDCDIPRYLESSKYPPNFFPQS